MVHGGHQQGLPKLDLEADLSAIQLVSPKTTKEEIISLYLKVYKQQRLLGSLQREPELMRRWCPPSKAPKGRRKRGHPVSLQGPDLSTPSPQRAEFLGRGRPQ